MSIRNQSVAITTDASGAGTAVTPRPVIGEIYEIRTNAAQFSATADTTVTRNGAYGGTVATISNNIGPYTVSPRFDAVTTAGAGGSAVAQVACDNYLTFTVAQGGSVTSGTIYVIYNEC